MTNYEYECTACGEEYSELRSMLDYREKGPTVICPHCKQKSLERIISAPAISKIGGPRTVGSLAEQNFRKNKDKILEEKEKKRQEKWEHTREASAKKGVELPKEQPKAKHKMHGNKTVKEINNMTPEQKKRYLMEGK